MGRAVPWVRGRLRLEVHDVEVPVLTGILSEETKLPQPLLVSVSAELDAPDPFQPETPLSASKNYMDLKRAVVEALPRDRHFSLIEAVADHIIETILFDPRVRRVEVKIVKLAISANGESIGITLIRERP
jgi:dihydroneopterin aldolase